MKQSQREGAVRGDRHCPLSKQVLSNSGFPMKTDMMPKGLKHTG
jgi:hypothetical protein